MQKINRQTINRSRRGDHHVHVPEELVFEILLRLPVKSLIRFKIVCKCWYNLITSSNFIRNHFGSNNCTRILTNYHLLNHGRFYETGFAVFEYETLTRLHREFYYSSTPFYMQCILGPVNGLLLLGNDHGENYRLALFNPATRELRTLSDLIYNLSFYVFGFGFDPLTNDFKVVAFWESIGEHDWPIGPLNMSVYSLANDSWKHLSPYDREKMHTTYSDAPYINGACYWLSNDDNFIVSFDFGSEVVREINGPQNTPKYDYASLFIYNYESLAMFGGMYTHWSFEIVSIDLLVMKEEGCWTKHLSIDVSLLHVLQPLGVWKNDKLLLETYEGFNKFKMVLYDPVTHEIKELEIQPQENISLGGRVIIYNESLVSLEGTKKDKIFCDSGDHLVEH